MQEKEFQVRENVEATPENMARFYTDTREMVDAAARNGDPIVAFFFHKDGFTQQGVGVTDEHIARLTIAMMKTNPLAMSWAFQEVVKKASELASALEAQTPKEG